MTQNPLEPSPLSPDLDWMLQSDQVSDQAVAEAIARDHFSAIYSLVRAYLEDRELASAIVFETISLAVANRRNYWGDIPVRAWLFTFAFRLCQENWLDAGLRRLGRFFTHSETQPVTVMDEPPDGDVCKTLQACRSMPRREFVGLLLQETNKLDNCCIGRVMNLGEARVEKLLSRAHQKVGKPKPEILHKALSEYESDLSFNPQQVQELVAGIEIRAVRHFRLRKFAISLNGMVFIAAVVVMVLAFTWYASGSLFGAQPTPKVPVRTLIVYVTPTPQVLASNNLPAAVPGAYDPSAPPPTPPSSENDLPNFDPGLAPETLLPSNDLPIGILDPMQDSFPKKASLNFAFILQYYQNLPSIQENNTGPVCLGIALQYLGWNGSALTIISDLMPNPKDGNVMAQEMADYVQTKTNYRALVRLGGSVGLLQRLVAAGFPVILQSGERGPDSNGWFGRYEIVTGYDWLSTQSDNFTLLSLEAGQARVQTLSYDRLASDWLAFNDSYLVVYAPNEEKALADILGSDYSQLSNNQNVYHQSYQQVISFSTGSLQRFFALFNRASILTYLEDYHGAAVAYDEALAAYQALPEKDRPWRIFWYQTRPYWAYYYTGQFGQVVTLADRNLAASGDTVLEESYYWRALAKEALGDFVGAKQDLKTAIDLNPNFAAGLYQYERLKSGG